MTNAPSRSSAMAKKQSPLKNRLVRHVTTGKVGVVAAALRPADEDRPLFEVCWDVLNPVCPLAVTDADELTERLTERPPFGSAQATGWIAGILGTALEEWLGRGIRPAEIAVCARFNLVLDKVRDRLTAAGVPVAR